MERLEESEMFIQVIMGPRQVGKTTGIKQALEQVNQPSLYQNADDLLAPGREWIIGAWQKALSLGSNPILVLDEIQKVPNWSETVKALWDQNPYSLKLVVLGSSSLKIQEGLSESLAGRFEQIEIRHWSFQDYHKAFGNSLEKYLFFGGYPGSVRFENEFSRWQEYIKESIVEAVISKDIMNIRRITHPALFRQAFEICCEYPAQDISFTKLLGQLQDRGNTDLIKSYIELFDGAFLLTPIYKFSAKAYLSRSSSPKLIPACPALCHFNKTMSQIENKDWQGRIFEMSVGNSLIRSKLHVNYWKQGEAELDFVVQHGGQLFAIEVKSGRKRSSKGLSLFKKQYQNAKILIIDQDMYASFEENPVRYLETMAL